ncbi:DUF397 domain-containing protein [Streptomyces sp. NPDC008150]|uniref:DUF397 domain-containing protein n=1 Tax=Streptomyces sp. NPDC008150 TaxID=3364816 RepID=UPI0036DFA779
MAESKTEWRKSSASAQSGDCVEVAMAGQVRVRNSNFPGQEVVAVFPRAWIAFIEFVKDVDVDAYRPD